MKVNKYSPLSVKKRKENFLKIFKNQAGIIPVSCEKAKITPKTYYQWLKKDEKFKEAVEEIQDNLLDLAISVAKYHLDLKNADMAKFIIKMRGRKRGYGESVDITSKDEKIDIQFNFGVTDETED